MRRMCSLMVALVALTPALASAQEGEPPSSAPAASQPTSRDRLPTEYTIDELIALAKKLKELQRWADMQNVLDLVLKRDPANIEAKLLGGEFAEDANDATAARKLYKEVLDVNPNDFRANLGMGRVYIKSRIWRQATFHLELAERVAPSERLSEVQTLLAQAYLGSGAMLKAGEAAERAVAGDRNNFEARQVLISIRVTGEQFEQAIRHAEALTEIARKDVADKPNDVDALRKLNVALATRIETLQKYFPSLYQKDVRGNTTDVPIAGKERDAAAVLKQITDLLFFQAELQRTLTYHGILRMAEKAVELDPYNPEYKFTLGQLYRNTSHPKKAIEMFQKVLELDPQHQGAAKQLQAMNAPLTSQPAEPATPAPEQATAVPAQP